MSKELSDHVQKLKERVADVVHEYLKENPIDDPDNIGFVVSLATTVVAALYIQQAGGNKAQLYLACDAQWDFVKSIYELKDLYDKMTPEERQKVISGVTLE